MNKNLDLVAKELYAKISSYPNLVMKDPEGNDVESDQAEGARKFNFEYEVDGKNLATITISLNDNSEDQDAFEVLISNDPAEGSDEYAKKMFLKFGREMREFAKQHMLTFNIHVATRSNKERDTGDSIMSESKLFGTAKTSYQRIGEATLIIKHRDVVNQENPAGRAQRIESIYVENAQGERFKYPFKHLNGARAMAQHVAHGGNPYDGIGQYMVGLSEELNRLRMFKSYVERNDMVSEAMGSINSKVMERIEQVKREIQHLQRPTHYAEFAESFTESESVEIPEEIMNDWIDRLTIRTFNEELKNVFPYIFKLVSEDDIPVKELSVEDLVNEDGPSDDEEEPDSSILPELAEYEQYLARLTESEQEGIFAAENEDALAELNQLLANPMPLGVDGTNVVQSLEGLGFDKDFLNGLKKMASDETGEGMDARPFIKEYVQQKDAELGTDVLSQLTFGDDNAAAAAEPEPVEAEPATDVMPPAEEPAAEQPVETPPAEELPMPPAPVAEAMMRAERSRMFDELKEFIKSMYNVNEGNFPKGVEGVKIACEKKFGDRVGPIAAKIVERMTSMGEMARMKKLSGMGEGTINELSKKTLGKYVKAAAKDAEEAGRDQEYHGHKNDYARGEKRQKGISKAVDRLTKEDSALSELSKGTLEKYKSKAKAQAKNARYYGNYGDPDDPQDVKDQYHKFADKREAGAKKADARLKKEDVVSEVSKDTLKSYIPKAEKDFKDKISNPYVSKETSKKFKRDIANREKGMARAVDRLTKEDSELAAMLRIAGLR